MKFKLFFSTLIVLSSTITNAQSPGNIASSFWVRADSSVEEAVSDMAEHNDPVSNVNDLSVGYNCDQTILDNRPIFRDAPLEYINYNPTIEFVNNAGAATDKYFDLTTPEVGSFDVYLLVKTNQTTTNTNFWDQPLIFGGDQNLASDVAITIDNGGFLHIGGGYSGDFNIVGTTVINSNLALIIQVSRTVNSASNVDYGWRINGAENGFSNRTEPNNGLDMTGSINIGLHGNSVTESFEGFISEVVVYSGAQNAINQQKIESYLAIKYGITLPNNYISTGGNLIYDVSTYNNDIIGIGRDDNEDLTQKQSHSVDDTSRIYINTLQNSNAANTGVFTTDESYVVIGHDQGKLCATASSNVEIPSCGLFSRLEREWKVTKSNLGQLFNVDLKLEGCANLTNVDPSHLRFLVDDDGDFSNGGTTCYFNGDGTGIVLSYNNPTITVSNISDTHILNNSTKYVTIASISAGTPLPIKLIEFNAIPTQNQEVELTWQTASEINNDYFTIERSKDGINWNEIGEVEGAGNSSITLDYNLLDPLPFLGVSYYRLKQTDYDGQFTYSEKRKIIFDNGTNRKVSIYPNPTYSKVIVSGVHSELTIYNMIGEIINHKIMQQVLSSTSIQLDLNSLPVGIYYIKTDSGAHRIVKK